MGVNRTMADKKTILEQKVAILKGIAHPVRLAVVEALADHEMCVCDIANALSMTKSSISHQLSTLRRSGIVKCKKVGKEVAILQDLQGPKIRLGDLVDNNFPVQDGDEIVLDFAVKEHDGGNTLPVQYNLAEKVKVGEPVFIFDGKVRSEVIEIPSETAIKLKVHNKGTLMSRKGLNLPDTDFGGDF